jgi:hypothetical protein
MPDIGFAISAFPPSAAMVNAVRQMDCVLSGKFWNSRTAALIQEIGLEPNAHSHVVIFDNHCRETDFDTLVHNAMETFDLSQTQKLAELTAVPQEQHDPTWCDEFLRAVPNASLASFDPQVQTGPDTFPYFQLALPDAGPFTPFSIVHILNDVLAQGAGVVVHANLRRDQQPLWVFSFGDILSYSLFQDFKGDPKLYTKPNPPPDKSDRNILVASPSEAYLPAPARAVIARFMRGPFQHPSPKIGLVTGASLSPRQSLMVNLRLKDYGGDKNKLGSAMRYLTWFLPKTYSMMPLPDDWSDADMSPL